MSKYFRTLLFVMGCLITLPLHALTVEQPLSQASQEEQAQHLFKDLRCMVCTGESIHDSDALLAQDMRRKVRDLIQEGKSSEEIRHYFVTRYGEQILMGPPFSLSTVWLWVSPLLFIFIGSIIFVRSMKRRV